MKNLLCIPGTLLLLAVTALSTELLQTESVTAACLAATRGLGRWTDDIRAADIYLRVGDELVLVASNRRTEAAPLPAAVLREHVARGELGMKTGRGLREWPADEAQAVRDRLVDHLVRTTRS